METAISRRAGLGLVAIGIVLTGCGAKSGVASSTQRSSATSRATSTSPVTPPSTRSATAFGWLRAGSPPSGWPVAAIPIGAAMPYPPGWRRIASDRGTATAALLDRRHHFLGYLNLTPRQSSETPADWARFRLAHNADENERDVRTLAVGTGLQFRAGHGSCVRDAYTTTTHTRYIEIACLDVGRRTSVVIIGASPAHAWPLISPVLEQAISGVSA